MSHLIRFTSAEATQIDHEAPVDMSAADWDAQKEILSASVDTGDRKFVVCVIHNAYGTNETYEVMVLTTGLVLLENENFMDIGIAMSVATRTIRHLSLLNY